MREQDQAARALQSSDGQHQHDAPGEEAAHEPASDEKMAANGAAGDAAVRRMIAPRRGPKLAVGHDGDEHEREADRVADEVVGDSGEHAAHDGEHAAHDGEHAAHDGEHAESGAAEHEAPAPTVAAATPAPALQKRSREGATAGGEVAAAETAPDGGGQSLPSAQRSYFEARMGHDFGQVRIHADGAAGAKAERLGAQAFTSGSDITFAPGQYRPDSTDGKKLLAHELTHVAQQGAASRAGGAAPKIAGGAHGQVQLRRHHKSGNFFSRAGRNFRRIGRDVARGFKSYGLPFLSTPGLIIEPDALKVLATHGFKAFATYMVEKFTNGSASAFMAVLQMFTLLPQGPELVELTARILSNVRPLNGEEKAAARFVLGDSAIDWSIVRVAQNTPVARLLAHNKTSMTLAHTIFRAPGSTIDIMVHECIHCFQYERLGLQYMPQCVEAQRGNIDYTIGSNKGGVDRMKPPNGGGSNASITNNNGGGNGNNRTQAQRDADAQSASQADGGSNHSDIGLAAAVKRGKHYRDFNREQQAMIGQEFFEAYYGVRSWQPASREDVANAANDADAAFLAYCYLITELRKGQF